MKRLLAALCLTVAPFPAAPTADTPYGADELIEKARAEGRIVFYANR